MRKNLIPLLTILTGWLAFICDFFIVSKMANGGLGDVLYIYLTRSGLYLVNIFLIILNQMQAETVMRQFGSQIPAVKLDYWYGTLSHYIPHYLVSSVLRIYSELAPLTIFAIGILLYYPKIAANLIVVSFAVGIFLIFFFYIQRIFTNKAAIAVERFVSQTTKINLVEKVTCYHLEQQKNFLVQRKNKLASSFQTFNTLAVSFSQSVRYQIEIVVVIAIYLFSSTSIYDPAVLYVLFRFGSSALQVVSILSSIAHYRIYFRQMLDTAPQVRFFGDAPLRFGLKL